MTVLILFFEFFKIGLFSFGGGAAMIPLIEDVVVGHGWLTAQELLNFIAVCESTPGPIAVNTATYIGFEVAGVGGAALATLGVILPSFIIILLVARIYAAFRKNQFVDGAMRGLRPAACGLIAAVVWNFFGEAFDLSALLSFQNLCLLVIIGVGILLLRLKAHPAVIIIVSAALGIASGYLLEII